MDSRDFKKLFNAYAINNGFESAHGGWIKESDECILVLELQKSSFGDYFELNIKIYIQGIFGYYYVMNKDLIKKYTGDVFTRPPLEFKQLFDFDIKISEVERIKKTVELFDEFINPLTEKALSREGIIVLGKKDMLTFLPAVENELNDN